MKESNSDGVGVTKQLTADQALYGSLVSLNAQGIVRASRRGTFYENFSVTDSDKRWLYSQAM